MSPIERAARSAELADEAFVAEYPGTPEIARASPDWSKAIARAVLLANYEPPPEVMRAGETVEIDATCDECPYYKYDIGDKAREVWQAMIDEALQE